MAKWYDYLKPIGWGNPITGKKNKNFFKDFVMGTPGSVEQLSTLRPEQEAILSQAINAAQSPGAGGAFGAAADYYRDLMSDDPKALEAYANPAKRQYFEEIVPGISEQFAGMGSGGLSSSGFKNAQTQGAVDLAERIGQIRANLKQAGAQGLTNIGQIGLGNYQTNYEVPGTEGFFSSVAPAVGTAAGAAIGGPAGAAIGNAAGQWFQGKGNKVGANTSPYGMSAKASPQIGNAGFQVPNFMQGQRGF